MSFDQFSIFDTYVNIVISANQDRTNKCCIAELVSLLVGLARVWLSLAQKSCCPVTLSAGHSMYVCLCIWIFSLELTLQSISSSRRTRTTLSWFVSNSLVWIIASSIWHHWDIAKAFDTINTIMRLFSILWTMFSMMSRPANQSLSWRHRRRL